MKGSAAPQRRFWIAMANENTSRPKPSSCVMGWRKKPMAERGPNVRIAIRQPQPMISAGVRQPSDCGCATVVIPCPSGADRSESNLGGDGLGPQHRLLFNRQVDHGRQYAE